MTAYSRWSVRVVGLISVFAMTGCGTKPTTPSGNDRTAMLASARLSPETSDFGLERFRAIDKTNNSVADTVNLIDVARQVAVENISNAETTAYKAQRVVFEGKGQIHTTLDFTQGSMQDTSNPLDVAIQGNGFIAVKLLSSLSNGGVGYTRMGNLVTNSVGSLVLNVGSGYQLVPPITIPTNATNVAISFDGTVTYVKAGSTTKSTAGQIKLAIFPNPEGMNIVREGIYSESEASGAARFSVPGNDGSGQIFVGYLESSNVNLTREKLRCKALDEWRAALIKIVGAD